MPLDPSIPLSFRSPRPYDPLEGSERAMNVANLAQYGRERREAMRDRESLRRQQEAEQKKLAEIDAIIAKHTSMKDGRLIQNDKAIVRDLIAAGFHAEAQQWQTRLDETKREIEKMDDAELERQLKLSKQVNGMFGRVVFAKPENRAQVYQAVREEALRLGLPVPPTMPEQYSEELEPALRRMFNSTLEAKQLLEEEEKKRPKRTPGYEQWLTDLYPGWLEKNNLKDSPGNRHRGWMEYKLESKRQPRTPVPGVDIPFSPEVEAQKGRMAAAGRPPKEEKDDSALIQAVLDNPPLYDSLTPTVRSRISAELAERGFTAFGKPLSDTAIRKISETRSAIASLEDLRGVLLKNEQYLGPLSGMAALNPYSEARKAQADVDRVRQRAGKALEGGVLRKEDEEKYKKILAVLTDTPETAIYKVDQLMEDLERDIQIFRDEQRKAGRKVAPDEKPKKEADDPLGLFP